MLGIDVKQNQMSWPIVSYSKFKIFALLSYIYHVLVSQFLNMFVFIASYMLSSCTNFLFQKCQTNYILKCYLVKFPSHLKMPQKFDPQNHRWFEAFFGKQIYPCNLTLTKQQRKKGTVSPWIGCIFVKNILRLHYYFYFDLGI